MKDTTMIQHASSFSGLAAVVFFASAALQGCAVGSASNVGDLDDPAGQPAAAGYLFDLTEDQVLSLYPLVESKWTSTVGSRRAARHSTAGASVASARPRARTRPVSRRRARWPRSPPTRLPSP
jgi:hypothetical protein